MESLLLSLLIVLALVALASLMAATECLSADISQSIEQASSAGSNHFSNRRATALSRLRNGLSQFGATGDVRRKLGRLLVLVTAALSFAFMPIAPPMSEATAATTIAADIDVAYLFVLAMFAVALFGDVLAGCSFQDPRITAERFVVFFAIALSAAGIVRLNESWRIDRIVMAQNEQGIWWLARQPLACTALLLCLIWQMSRITSTDQDEAGSSADRRVQADIELQQFGLRLQLIVLAYLFVCLFLGGWHVWGINTRGNEDNMNWIGWGAQFVALHLKAIALLLWLVWLRFIRLHDVPLQLWSSRLAAGAVIAAALNLVVVEFSERYLASLPDVWKAAAAWLVLFVSLILTGVCSRQISPD